MNGFHRKIHGFIFLCLISLSAPAVGAGERYAEQGHTLVLEMHRELVAKHICSEEFADFLRKVPLYGGHGDRVNFSIYSPDKEALAAIFNLLVLRGIVITNGVPISVSVYSKSRDDYGDLIFHPKYTIRLEINK